MTDVFSARFARGADRLAIVHSRKLMLDVTVCGSTPEWFLAVTGLLRKAGAFAAPAATVPEPRFPYRKSGSIS